MKICLFCGKVLFWDKNTIPIAILGPFDLLSKNNFVKFQNTKWHYRLQSFNFMTQQYFYTIIIFEFSSPPSIFQLLFGHLGVHGPDAASLVVRGSSPGKDFAENQVANEYLFWIRLCWTIKIVGKIQLTDSIFLFNFFERINKWSNTYFFKIFFLRKKICECNRSLLHWWNLSNVFLFKLFCPSTISLLISEDSNPAGKCGSGDSKQYQACSLTPCATGKKTDY